MFRLLCLIEKLYQNREFTGLWFKATVKQGISYLCHYSINKKLCGKRLNYQSGWGFFPQQARKYKKNLKMHKLEVFKNDPYISGFLRSAFCDDLAFFSLSRLSLEAFVGRVFLRGLDFFSATEITLIRRSVTSSLFLC